MITVKFIFIYLFTSLIVIFVSRYLNFFDKPNKRTVHSVPTVNTGGLILYIFFLITISQAEYNHNIELIVSIGFFVALAGFIDDRINLNPSTKILFLIFPSIYLILNDINISDLGKYEYIGIIELGKFKIPFLLLSIGLLINATNYIDGIDGLLLTFFSSCLIYYFFLIEDIETKNLLVIFIYGSLLNLVLNLLPSTNKIKIFSGDAGSLFIGFFISFITIELYNSFKIHPAYLVWPLWYPVYDFLFVSINRILTKKSVFKPDKFHLHHIIVNKFKSHLNTLIVFILLNTVIIYTGYEITKISKLLSLSTYIFGFFIFFILRILSLKKYK